MHYASVLASFQTILSLPCAENITAPSVIRTGNAGGVRRFPGTEVPIAYTAGCEVTRIRVEVDIRGWSIQRLDSLTRPTVKAAIAVPEHLRDSARITYQFGVGEIV